MTRRRPRAALAAFAIIVMLGGCTTSHSTCRAGILLACTTGSAEAYDRFVVPTGRERAFLDLTYVALQGALADLPDSLCAGVQARVADYSERPLPTGRRYDTPPEQRAADTR